MSQAALETETLTYREAVRAALREEMERDPDVFLMGEDIGLYGGMFDVTGDLYHEFGEDRVRDTPISEAGFTGAGVGAAMTGSRPVVEVMHSDFLGVAAEPILNQLAKSRYMFGGNVELPMTIRTTEGGGMNIAAQHDGTMHTWFAHLPGILAAAPATPRAAKGLLKASIRSNDPVMVFENKMLYDQEGEVPTDPDFTIPLGVANVVREGADITVVATQRLVQESIAVADELADVVDVEVIDPQTFYPLDTDTIVESVRKTGRMVVADESPLSYGTHSEIVTRVAETAPEVLEAPVRRVGVMDTHVPFSPPLEDEALPDGNDVRAAVEELA